MPYPLEQIDRLLLAGAAFYLEMFSQFQAQQNRAARVEQALAVTQIQLGVHILIHYQRTAFQAVGAAFQFGLIQAESIPQVLQ